MSKRLEKQMKNELFSVLIALCLSMFVGCGNDESGDNKDIFTAFLSEEIKAANLDNEEYTMSELLESSVGKYLYCDIDGDEADELHIRSDRYYFIIENEDGVLKVLYEGSPYEYPVKSDGLQGILYHREGGAPTHDTYQYFSVSSTGEVQQLLDFEWYDDNENDLVDEDDIYLFNQEEIEKQEWEEKTKVYRESNIGLENWNTWGTENEESINK